MKRLIAALMMLSAATPLLGQSLRILVGTYTEGISAEGVYLYSIDPESAESQLLDVAPSGNPSFVIASPDGKRAYAVNEFNDGRQGVSSFLLNGERILPAKSLPIPKEKVDGEDPCNILFTGDAVVTSNYTGGSVTAFKLDDKGELKELSQTFAPTSEKASHMHCAVLSPDGKYIFVTDLGLDQVLRFERGSDGAPLGESTIAWQNTAGTQWGPRHMVFSADDRFAYLLCELGDKLVVFSYQDGTLSPIQSLTAYNGKGKGSADIHISPDGRFLYTSHRLKKDGIGIFSIDPKSGKVKKAGFQKTGRHPRNFALCPDGKFLLCACRDDNRIEVYRVDKTSGALTRTDCDIQVGAPVCVQFVIGN